jgi:D-alanine-D-alanine ligase
MEQRRLRVAVIFGGRSAEHEVSLQSARNVVAALDPARYEVVLIGIDREGRWFLNENSLSLLNADDPRLIALGSGERRVALTPDGDDGVLVEREPVAGTPVAARPSPAGAAAGLGRVDVLFPVLHGPYGEDGSIQGLARLANLPCVGADILGSAVGMDKDIMKRLLRDAGLAIAPFLAFASAREAIESYEAVVAKLGADLFIKPANLGSSVGISHVRDRASYEAGVGAAFRYDTRIIVEAKVTGRELEVAVLGNDEPEASIPGEIIPAEDFYSYEAKYLDEHGAALAIPARVTEAESDLLRETAIKAYKALCARGMARVDFFLEPSGRVVVNEINTIPGFTRISMYPKLWEASGLPCPALVDRLIELALEDYKKRSALKSRPEIGNADAIEFREVEDEGEKERICRSVLADLPLWFGIPESNEEYARGVRDYEFMGIFEGEGAIGFASVKRNNDYTAEIYVMGIKARCHGQGLGTRLVEAVSKRMRAAGFEYLEVKTLDASRESEEYRRTRLFYESVGFRPFETMKELWGEANPCLIMVKKL